MARASSNKKATKKAAPKKAATKKATAKKATAKKAAPKKATAKKAATKKATAKKAAAEKTVTAKKAASTKKAATIKKDAPLVTTSKTNPQLAEMIKLQRGTISAIANLTNALQDVFSGAAISLKNLNAGHAHVVQDTASPEGSASVNDFLNSGAASQPTSNSFLDNEPAPAKSKSKAKLTKDHCIEALKKVSETHDIDRVMAILGDFKAQRVSDVQESDFDSFIKACNAACSDAPVAASTIF